MFAGLHNLPRSERLSFNIIFFYLEICDAKCWSKCWAERKESLWSRSLSISLSCCLSTWQLSKMSFSFDQSHPQRYLVHPVMWLVKQLKIFSNQKWRSKADGWKWGSQRSWPEAFFSRLLALRADKKNKRSGSRRKICQERLKESLWDQGIHNHSPLKTVLTCIITHWLLELFARNAYFGHFGGF